MFKKLNIAIGSTCSKPGDVKGNLEQISMLAAKAKANGCELLLTPELSASGYGGYEEVITSAETAGKGMIYDTLAELAKKNSLVMLAGFVEKFEDKRFISHYIVYPDGSFRVQRKHRVTPREFPLDPSVELYYDDTEEIGHVHAGCEQFEYFYVNGIKCVVIICADFGIRNLHRILSDNGVELLLLPTGAGGVREDRISNEELKTPEGLEKYYDLISRACLPGKDVLQCIEYKRAFAAVNMCGFDGKALYHGGSGKIINQFGDVVAIIPGIPNIDRQRPGFACGEIDMNEKL